MNNWNNQYSGYGWDRPVSNVQYCASLEDALSRCNRPNTENVFFHQDLPIFYRIKVDFDGKKYWQALEYTEPKPNEGSVPVVKSDLTEIVERLQRIENYVFQDVGVNSNEQSNG